jgi:hypothetical protein
VRFCLAGRRAGGAAASPKLKLRRGFSACRLHSFNVAVTRRLGTVRHDDVEVRVRAIEAALAQVSDPHLISLSRAATAQLATASRRDADEELVRGRARDGLRARRDHCETCLMQPVSELRARRRRGVHLPRRADVGTAGRTKPRNNSSSERAWPYSTLTASMMFSRAARRAGGIEPSRLIASAPTVKASAIGLGRKSTLKFMMPALTRL